LGDLVDAEGVAGALGGLACGVLGDFENRLLVAGEVGVFDEILDRTGSLACGERAVEVRVGPVHGDGADALRGVAVVDSRATGDRAAAVLCRGDHALELACEAIGLRLNHRGHGGHRDGLRCLLRSTVFSCRRSAAAEST